MNTIDGDEITAKTPVLLICMSLPRALTKHLRRPMEHGAHNLPNTPLLNNTLDLQQSRTKPRLKPHQRPHALLPRQLQQLLRLPSILRKRPLAENILAGLQCREQTFIMQVHTGGAHNELDVWVCSEVFGGTVGLCGRGEAVDFDGLFSGVDGGVAEGDDFVLGGGFEVGEVGPNGPGLVA